MTRLTNVLILAAMALSAAGSTAGAVQSTFDAGAEGWTVADLWWPYANPPSVVGTYTPNWDPSGGSPGGYIWATDPSSNWFAFAAPGGYLGDKSAFSEGTLSFDFYHYYQEGAFVEAPGVILVGNGSTLYSKPVAFTASWQHCAYGLAAGNWYPDSGTSGIPVTQQDLESILQNLSAVYINGEYINGMETSAVDNVTLAAAPEPTSILALLGGLGSLVAFRRRRA